MKHLSHNIKYHKTAIRLLERAKDRLENFKNFAVCSAVLDSSRTPFERDVATLITREIGLRIAPSVYVTGWLEKEHGIWLNQASWYGQVDERRAYRMAWIDNMIEELKS